MTVSTILILTSCTIKKQVANNENQTNTMPTTPPYIQTTITPEPTQIPSELAAMTKEAEKYPSNFPKFTVVCKDKSIQWIRGDSNYTGKLGGKVGNTSFGADEVIAEAALKATEVEPGTVITAKADEVVGLDKPKCKFLLFDKNKNGDKFVAYPSTNNQITVPQKEEEYLFVCDVNWGKGDNEITYLFKVKVVSGK